MGLRGPAPKPTVVKIREGNPGKRRINTREPVGGPLKSPPPESVKKVPAALKAWKRLKRDLSAQRSLQEADFYLLQNVCLDIALLEAAMSKLAATPMVIHNKDTGVFRQNPLLLTVATLTKRVNAELRELGATPAGRAGLSTDTDGVDHAFDDF